MQITSMNFPNLLARKICLVNSSEDTEVWSLQEIIVIYCVPRPVRQVLTMIVKAELNAGKQHARAAMGQR